MLNDVKLPFNRLRICWFSPWMSRPHWIHPDPWIPQVNALDTAKGKATQALDTAKGKATQAQQKAKEAPQLGIYGLVLGI